MGAGSTVRHSLFAAYSESHPLGQQYYALGEDLAAPNAPGPTLTGPPGSHFQAFDLSKVGSACSGAYELRDTTDAGTMVYMDSSCGTTTGDAAAPFLFTAPKLLLTECSLIDTGINYQPINIVCAATSKAAHNCASAYANTLNHQTITIRDLTSLAFSADSVPLNTVD
jgi:hypothetical protein